MRKGQDFAMSARGRGIYLHSSSNRVQEVESERGIPYFRVKLPTNVLYQQRRKAARFRLPLRVATNGASVSLFRLSGDKQPITGRIIDISAGGCRAQFDGPVMLDPDEKLRCAVDIPDMLDFSADAIVRHSAYDKKTRTLTCGLELASMQVTDRRRLEQFLESIRRMEERASGDH
jgi:c-di-GMP-binding flagellar brake protein YcgR